jgi:hypothetical protein
LVEDVFWESPYTSFLHDEYFSITNNVNSIDFFKKQEAFFNTNLRSIKDRKLKNGLLSKPFLPDLGSSSNLSALPIFSEEFFLNSNLVSTRNFHSFSNEIACESIEDSYESSKYLNYLYFLNYKNILNSLSSNIYPLSYASVFDSFRSDYEELYIYSDEAIGLPNGIYSSQEDLTKSQPIRFSNPLKLRSTVKNAIVTYNAIQKVFRSRFDEGRSNARLEDFSNSYVKHPFLTDNRIGYESILGKNKEFFLKINLYNRAPKLNFSNLTPMCYANNIYFIDLPFLMSMKSDPTRYLWFD